MGCVVSALWGFWAFELLGLSFLKACSGCCLLGQVGSCAMNDLNERAEVEKLGIEGECWGDLGSSGGVEGRNGRGPLQQVSPGEGEGCVMGNR